MEESMKEKIRKWIGKMKDLRLGSGIMRNLKVFSLTFLILLAIAMSTTDITDQSISTPELRGTTLNDTVHIMGDVSYNEASATLYGWKDGTQANLLKWAINGTPDNTDIFTIRTDVYTNETTTANPYGTRNLVSRVNTYSPDDNANIYSVWNDYGSSRGANIWAYIYEWPCDTTYGTDCTSGNPPKYGLVLRFAELENGTDKEGLRVENQDEQYVEHGIRFIGNYTYGINSGPPNEGDYSDAFINANMNSSIDSSAIKITQTGDGSSIKIRETVNTPVGYSIDLSSKRNNATVFIDNPLRGANTLQVFLADAQNSVATNGSNIFSRTLTATSTVSPVVGLIQGHSGDDQPTLQLINEGSGQPIRITPNSTASVCNAPNNGGTYYDGTNLYNCNGSEFRPVTQDYMTNNGSCTIITGSTSTLEVC